MACRSVIALSMLALVAAGLPARAASPAAPSGPAQEVRDVALVDALTWGANQSTMAAFHALGREAWLQGQLHPGPDPLPPAAQQQIDALTVSRTSPLDLAIDFETRAKAANQVGGPAEKQVAQKAFQDAMNDLAKQAASASILRALYSPAQLRERMTWFWFNHFNVHQYKGNVRVLLADYENGVIRPHALGRFRDLLAATLRHPAMLRYLDNADNAAGKINENYAREIMELHTMGVGSGYSQKDVEELARILTGVGVDTKPEPPKLKPEWQPLLVREGLFTFNPARHDFGDKVLLGHTIKGRGFGEVEEALDILARQPATARHISQQIATYFVADDPPPALVERMAQSFQRTDGDIAAVLDTMLHAPEFTASLGTRFKDPVRYILSAVRLAYDTKVVANTAPIQNWFNRLGEGLYNHQTPDGYPLSSAAWTASGQMTLRFEIARQIGSNSSGLFKPPGPDAVDQPAFPLLQNSLYFSSLHASLSPATRQALEQAVSPQDWNTLFLSSPEFMQ